MSVKCPSCGAPVDHDFGVTSCAKCGVVLFVDFDGQVQVSTPESVAAADEKPVSEVTSGSLPDSMSPEEFLATNPGLAEEAPLSFETVPVQEYNFESPLDSQLGDDSPVSFEPPSFEIPADGNAIEGQPIALQETSFEGSGEPETDSATDAPGEANMDWFENSLDQNLDAQNQPAAPVNQVVDFSDVVEFANSAELDNSSLVYRLRIEGIDHKDIRRRVESVLSDPKLNFHMKDLIPRIKDGRLDLLNLSPVRASVIASRLREENVRFFWSQAVFESGAEGDFGENAS